MVRKDPRIHWLRWDDPQLVDSAYALAGTDGNDASEPAVPTRRERSPHGRLSGMRHWSFAKGHGTGNDFVVLLDREAMMLVGEPEVRFLCDRHRGIGGDGLLRAMLARHVQNWDGDPSYGSWTTGMPTAQWRRCAAMDCRSSFGSCCSTIWLPDLSSRWPLEPVLEATVLPNGQIRVAMGPVDVRDRGVRVRTVDGAEFAALTADVGNPHA